MDRTKKVKSLTPTKGHFHCTFQKKPLARTEHNKILHLEKKRAWVDNLKGTPKFTLPQPRLRLINPIKQPRVIGLTRKTNGPFNNPNRLSYKLQNKTYYDISRPTKENPPPDSHAAE